MDVSTINKYLYYFILFIGTNGYVYFNIDINTYYAYYLGFMFFLSLLWINNRLLHNKALFYVFAVICIEFIYKCFILKHSGAFVYSIPILGAPIGLLAFNEYLTFMDRKRWNDMFLITLVFYIVECNMAIFERIIGETIIGYNSGTIQLNIETTGIFEFRSTALWAHPLANALIVSVLMSYFLVSNLKLKYKLSLWVLGYVAILCFNTRGSIIGNALILLVYLSYSSFFSKRTKDATRVEFIIAVILLSMVIVYISSITGIGGRLITGSFSDSSVQTRYDIWYIFKVIGNDALLYGTDDKGIDLLMMNAKLYALENCWIILAIRFGIIFLALYVFAYFLLFKHLFVCYKFIDKSIIISTFILIASTYDSLANNFHSLLVCMICSFIFNPRYLDKYLSSKYIETRNKQDIARILLHSMKQRKL